MGTTAQINIRIEPQLKADADRILARHGISPSQAIRGLYESIAKGGESTKQAMRTITACNPGERQNKSDVQRKLQSIRDVQAMLASCPEHAAAANRSGELPNGKELLEEAICEHHNEKGLGV